MASIAPGNSMAATYYLFLDFLFIYVFIYIYLFGFLKGDRQEESNQQSKHDEM